MSTNQLIANQYAPNWDRMERFEAYPNYRVPGLKPPRFPHWLHPLITTILLLALICLIIYSLTSGVSRDDSNQHFHGVSMDDVHHESSLLINQSLHQFKSKVVSKMIQVAINQHTDQTDQSGQLINQTINKTITRATEGMLDRLKTDVMRHLNGSMRVFNNSVTVVMNEVAHQLAEINALQTDLNHKLNMFNSINSTIHQMISDQTEHKAKIYNRTMDGLKRVILYHHNMSVDANNASLSQPRVTIDSPPQTIDNATPGSEIHLYCKVTNLGQNVIEWKLGNNTLFRGSDRLIEEPRMTVVDDGQELIIKNVTQTDSGVYKCDVLTESRPTPVMVHPVSVLYQ